jgi:hypothetical protein
MDMCGGGDCVILLRIKIDECHGRRVYKHYCRERTKNEDFKIYYDLEEKIKNNTLTDDYIKEIGGAV